MKSCLCVAVLLMVCVGCTPSNIKEMSKKTWQAKTLTTPEMEAVMSWTDPAKPLPPAMSHTELNRRILFAETDFKETGVPPTAELKALASFVKDAGFQERLKALEAASFPDAYATPERLEARKKYLDEWKTMEKLLSSNGKFEAVKQSMDKLSLYYRQLQFIPGQTPPTGEATKQYSAVQEYQDPYKETVP